MKPFLAAALAVALALAACGEQSSSSKTAPADPPRTVIDPQLRAMDKARGLEQTLSDQAESQRRTIDDDKK